MSRVYVLAAERALPLCDGQCLRTGEGGGCPIAVQQGFGVGPLDYYQQAVEELDYPMKPFRYEILLGKNEQDLQNLQAYLKENFSLGETLKLWSVWVGDVEPKHPPRFRGKAEDLDMDALEQFFEEKEACFTITI